MITKKYSIIILLTFNLLLAYYNQGISISESDNTDAIFYNPAGLAIDRGSQFGLFANHDQDSTFIFSNFKSTGFGMSVGYNTQNLSDIHSFRIGFATKIHKNLYYGLAWDKTNVVDVGLMYRPFNLMSIGLKSTLTDNFSNFINHNAALAIRPFGSEFLTLGFDQNFDSEWEMYQTSIFLKAIPIAGIEISAKLLSNQEQDGSLNFDVKADNLLFNIGFNIGQNKFYANSHNEQLGLGFVHNSYKEASIFDTKNKPKYVSLVLDDIFIEEKPIKKRFNFTINIFDFGNRNNKSGTQLRTWIEKIDNLTTNPNIEGMIIYLKSINASFSKRVEIRNALKRFQNSGKKIIIYSETGISNMDYHIASIADEIYVNPLTGIDLKGMRMEVTFYRGLLDTLKIKPKIWRVQDKEGNSYKTAGDPFLNTKMSEQMKENYGQLLDGLNEVFVKDIAIGRGWLNEEKKPNIEYTQTIINEGPYWQPEAAKDRNLMNGTFYPDQFEKYLKDSISKNIVAVSKKIPDYNYAWKEEKKPRIAMIYAVGGIMSGKSNPGPRGSSVMGDKTIMKAIKQARNDDSIEAIILRIDSGGGSAIASDQMWREIYKTTNDSTNKKPFIASMSGVAASGGYYIACEADTIIAQNTTITGSIGVIGMAFNLSELYNRIGINKEVIKRGEFSDFLTQSRDWTDEENEKMQKSIEYFYDEFKSRVLEGRTNLTSNELDNLALGRVWTGNEAFKNGLIDEVGGINETIEIAKIMSGIDKNQDIDIVEYPNQNTNKGFTASFSSFMEENSSKDFQLILEIMPESIQKELNNMNIIPILKDEKIYFIMPYNIEVN